MIGAIGGNTQSISYAIGSITVNSSIAGGNPPLTYVNFSGQTSGATLTTAILNSATTCGNGTWGAQESGSPAIAETISSDVSLPLTGSLTACGSDYSDAIGSPVLRFDLSQTTAEYAEYTWHTYSPSASLGFWFETTVATTDTGYYAGWGIGNVLGSDFAGIMNHSGQIYIETEGNPNGPPTQVQHSTTPPTPSILSPSNSMSIKTQAHITPYRYMILAATSYPRSRNSHFPVTLPARRFGMRVALATSARPRVLGTSITPFWTTSAEILCPVKKG